MPAWIWNAITACNTPARPLCSATIAGSLTKTERAAEARTAQRQVLAIIPVDPPGRLQRRACCWSLMDAGPDKSLAPTRSYRNGAAAAACNGQCQTAKFDWARHPAHRGGQRRDRHHEAAREKSANVKKCGDANGQTPLALAMQKRRRSRRQTALHAADSQGCPALLRLSFREDRCHSRKPRRPPLARMLPNQTECLHDGSITDEF